MAEQPWTRSVVRVNSQSRRSTRYGVIVSDTVVLSLAGADDDDLVVDSRVEVEPANQESLGSPAVAEITARSPDGLLVISLDSGNTVSTELWHAIAPAVGGVERREPPRPGAAAMYFLPDQLWLRVVKAEVVEVSDRELITSVFDKVEGDVLGAPLFLDDRLIGLARGIAGSQIRARPLWGLTDDIRKALRARQKTRKAAPKLRFEKREAAQGRTLLDQLPATFREPQPMLDAFFHASASCVRAGRAVSLLDVLTALLILAPTGDREPPERAALHRLLGNFGEELLEELVEQPSADPDLSAELSTDVAFLLHELEAASTPAQIGWPLALFTALLVDPGAIWPWLEQAADRKPTIDALKIERELVWLLSQLDPDTAQMWRRLFGQGVSIRPPTEVAYAHDHPDKHDALNVKDQAARFATLIADPDTIMPLSLGLFGDWGTGKSHFIRLLQTELTKRSPAIAQIEFNAWHYMDADLWASVALRIYDGLAEALTTNKVARGEDDYRAARADYEQTRLEVLKSLESQRESKERAEQLQIQVKRQHGELLEKIDETRRKVDKTKLELSKSVYEGLRKELSGEDLAALKPVLSWLEIDLTRDGPDALARIEARLDKLVEQGRGAGTVLAGILTGLAPWTAGAWLLAILAAIIALDYSERWLDQVDTTVAQILAAVAGGVALVNRRSDELRRALDAARSIRAKICVALSEPATLTAEQRQLRDELRTLEDELAGYEAQAADASAKIESLAVEIERIDRGGLVYDFLGERSDDSDYRNKLGLISKIRVDLGRLRGFLDGWRKSGRDAPPRIVLYIDDLDRCPAARVVEVLQAVHLLLAFDLFAVVVAVDPRWLARSLYKQYVPEMFESGASASVRAGFDPHNYLEKIFQIPFSLPPMERDGFRQLVELTLDGPKRDSSSSEDSTTSTTTATDKPEQVAAKTPPEASNDTTLVEQQRAPETDQAPKALPNSTPARESPEPAKTSTKPAQGLSPLTEWERSYLSALHEFVPTPRLTKRLINIYRLLRLQAADPRKDNFGRFINRYDGDYRAVLLLLGMAIGYPHLIHSLLDGLDAASGVPEWSLIAHLEALLRSQRPGPSRTAPLPAGLRETPEALLASLRVLDGEVGVFGKLETYQRWAPHIRRFTFESLDPTGFSSTDESGP